MVEIERKFLVNTEAYKATAFRKTHITQGFLSTDPERTVRVRVRENQGFLTIKGQSNNSGTTRFEWEKEIDVQEAKELLSLCKKGVIDKIRHEVECAHHIYEIDEFLGDNKGLIVAEIELSQENEMFKKPAWLGQEVTGEVRYYNSQLSVLPFCDWR